MTSLNSCLKFNLKSYNVLSKYHYSKDDWLSFFKCNDYKSNHEIKFTSIPGNIKRRASFLSKLAIETATSLIKSSKHVDFAIFASQHGEIDRTVGLLQQISTQEELSPTSFAQSVHNTASGLFSIANKFTQPITSLSSGSSTFIMALIEAYAYLNSNENNQSVLLVYFDEKLPSIYKPYVKNTFNTFSIGLILEKGNNFKIEFETKNIALDDAQHIGKEFIEFLYGNASSKSINQFHFSKLS
ncbi:hypothetical protein CF386_11435 [Paraphotobacterium marinum]|uniref:Beta-ketoacyl synthase-like N-terminal domain-containing protein n=1 Tax=Paraphotobacterium marinum TaxID=1755811 RepID=A0A220VH61_9GAMM|nr:hypothetical protein CF386_11435 [Paraphotobacterium marinum]